MVANPVDSEYRLPYDLDAEAAVLGALLIDPDALHRVTGIIRPDDFHRAKNQYCYAACLDVFNRREAVDQITVARALAQNDKLETVGGLPYLGQLVANTPTSVNVEHYAAIVADTAAKRRLIDAGNRIIELGMSDTDGAGETMRQATDILFNLRLPDSDRGFRHIASAYDQFLKSDNLTDQATTSAIPTGLSELDEIITGLHQSDLIILGARPGFGKSSLALNLCVQAARAGQVSAVYSLEMSIEQIALRILAAETGISSRNIRNGLYSEQDEHRIVECIGYLSGLPIYVDDTPLQTTAEMHAKAQRLQLEHGLHFLAVDYLQLIQAPAGSRPGSANLTQQTTQISRALKALARDLHIPVLACSQLSRSPETRQNHRPQLSDLRESGAIEQDADLVLFLYRPDQYHTEAEWVQIHPGQPYPRNLAEVIVAKHRHGPTGSASLYFREATMRFYRNGTAPTTKPVLA